MVLLDFFLIEEFNFSAVAVGEEKLSFAMKLVTEKIAFIAVAIGDDINAFAVPFVIEKIAFVAVIATIGIGK